MRPNLLFALGAVFVVATEADAKPRPHRASPLAQSAAPEDAYAAQYVTGPGGTRVPIRDYPGSATVVTRKMMDDFQARSVCDALRYAPGVTVGGGC